jgi:tetratricopeptide (TPR) repeat protein
MRALRIAGLLLLLAATAYSLHRFALLPLRCSRAASLGAIALETAERRPDYDRRRVAASVRESLRGCDCISPANVQIFLTRGGASAALDEHRAAIAEYQRALTIDRRPEIYFALGMSYLQVLDRPAAIRNLRRACAFDPSRITAIPYEDVRAEMMHSE